MSEKAQEKLERGLEAGREFFGGVRIAKGEHNLDPLIKRLRDYIEEFIEEPGEHEPDWSLEGRKLIAQADGVLNAD